ncbi:MAG: glycosyltransferase family 39 protein [Desulfobacteraceae bacterium]|nr:glycosyltransferase family 39 protein [Desulfobacteraceae bacterium]
MNNIRMERIIPIGLLYLILFAAAVAWGFSYDNWQLKEQLKWVSPLILEINFFLIITGIILNAGLFRNIFKEVTRRARVIVLLIAVGGVLLSMFVAPRVHRIFYDEDIYLNVGQNIADLDRAGMCNEGGDLYGEYFCNRLEYNKDPNGWPFLISLPFRMMGASHLAAYIMNNLIWGLSILVVFFTGFLIFGDEKAGLFGALVFSLIPEGLRWSNTTAAEPSAALFAGLAVLAVVVFARHPGNRPLFMACVLIPFAFQFRGESILTLLPAGLLILLMAPRELAKERTYLFLLLVVALALPHLIHVYAVKGQGWGAPGGVKFALKYLKQNFSVNALFFLKDNRFPLLFTLLFFLGVGMPIVATKETRGSTKTRFESFLWREKAILLAWFLAFWGIFLIFYAGSYNYGADVRFSLMSYMPFAILAGFGGYAVTKWLHERFRWEWVGSSLTLLILLWALSFFPYIRAETQEAWGARADHRYARIMAEKLPPNSLVLTHNPGMFLLWGKNAAQTSVATEDSGHMNHLFNRYRGGIYFHYNFWCNVSDPLQQSFCKNILRKFRTKKVISFGEQNYDYVLYRLERKGRG